MGISWRTDMTALGASRVLDLRHVLVLKNLERLSSGMRINTAADDPAGLVISEQMRSRIAQLNQEIANTNIAINKYETADSYLQQLRSMGTELRTLALAAADDSFTDENMRAAYQAEADNIIRTYNQIVQEASFAGHKLFDGSAGALAAVNPLEPLDISSPAVAAAAVSVVDRTVAELDGIISNVGATQKNDLESRLANMQVEQQNLIAAESQIRDTDYVREYSNFLLNQIMTRAAGSILSHHFMTARSVLLLLDAD